MVAARAMLTQSRQPCYSSAGRAASLGYFRAVPVHLTRRVASESLNYSLTSPTILCLCFIAPGQVKCLDPQGCNIRQAQLQHQASLTTSIWHQRNHARSASSPWS
jgi:hypothetical protein